MAKQFYCCGGVSPCLAADLNVETSLEISLNENLNGRDLSLFDSYFGIFMFNSFGLIAEYKKWSWPLFVLPYYRHLF